MSLEPSKNNKKSGFNVGGVALGLVVILIGLAFSYMLWYSSDFILMFADRTNIYYILIKIIAAGIATISVIGGIWVIVVFNRKKRI